ncbi:MAG: amino acid ABC transporter permease [Anaerolineae bacterium]|nr:MAG: amino acid ABC transporter permease [Anaerolineae bacterium]
MESITPEVLRPIRTLGPIAWLRRNLFNNWYNVVLTFIVLGVIYKVLIGLINFLLQANWDPVTTRPVLYLVGQYPAEELWRIGLAVFIISFLFGISWGNWGDLVQTFAYLIIAGSAAAAFIPSTIISVSWPVRIFFLVNITLVFVGRAVGRSRFGKPRTILILWLISLPIVIILIYGFAQSEFMPVVLTTLWGGLMVNLLLAAIGIAASFPVGVILALGRRSSLPVLRWFCIGFIEIVRGVPLITILFMASIILPLFLPGDIRIDRLIRALIGITMFSAAYMAENIRGGLQAIPLGQYDAAKAIGLNSTLTTLLIILPQAIRLVIPAIVGQFIALFKDTTLVLIVGLLEILGVGKAILGGNPQWVTSQTEVYLFVAAAFWVFTFSLSRSSRHLEKALGVGER